MTTTPRMTREQRAEYEAWADANDMTADDVKRLVIARIYEYAAYQWRLARSNSVFTSMAPLRVEGAYAIKEFVEALNTSEPASDEQQADAGLHPALTYLKDLDIDEQGVFEAYARLCDLKRLATT